VTTYELSDITQAVAMSVDMSFLNMRLEALGIKTDISEINMQKDGSVYIGGGENETAFEIYFKVVPSEITLGGSTYRIGKKEES